MSSMNMPQNVKFAIAKYLNKHKNEINDTYIIPFLVILGREVLSNEIPISHNSLSDILPREIQK